MEMEQDDKKLTINISGHRFETLRTTLEKYPDTLLGSNKREVFYNESNKEYFFDRDPDIFRHILNYYRTGKLHYPSNECTIGFVEELTFFGVLPEVIGVCCQKEYLHRKRENAERLFDIKALENFNASLPPLSSKRERLWKAFENARSSTGALILHWVIALLIVVSVMTIIVESFPCGSRPGRAGTLSCGERYNPIFFCVFAAYLLIFSIEYLLRLFAAPSRWLFIKSGLSVTDLLAIVPIYVGFMVTGDTNTGFLILRVFRLLNILQFSSHSLRILGATLASCAAELGFLVFSLLLTISVFATVLFHAEKDVDGTNFTSIPAAMWYTVVTMMTLGYGDMVPETIAGRILGTFCSLSGIVFFSFCVSVIVTNYSRVSHQYHRDDQSVPKVKRNDSSV